MRSVSGTPRGFVSPARTQILTLAVIRLGQISNQRTKKIFHLGTFLFKVEDRFVISDRGLILTPGLGDKVKFVKTGLEIRLMRPDKSEVTTSIIGITFESSHNILIPLTMKHEVPVGTEVWTIE
jgi:hypothetical protein